MMHLPERASLVLLAVFLSPWFSGNFSPPLSMFLAVASSSSSRTQATLTLRDSHVVPEGFFQTAVKTKRKGWDFISMLYINGKFYKKKKRETEREVICSASASVLLYQ